MQYTVTNNFINLYMLFDFFWLSFFIACTAFIAFIAGLRRNVIM